jgi:hypothetical protein
MVNSPSFEAKKAIGVGLRPSLWMRIDAYAADQGKSRAQVIEEILMANIPVVSTLRKSQDSSRTAEGEGKGIFG